MTTYHRGFTVIEVIFVVLFLIAAGSIFIVQKNNLSVAGDDKQKKIAINAMYYSLEEVYFKSNGTYPQTLNETVLPSVDPALFTDPNDHKIGSGESSYRYEPTNCSDGTCKNYTLRADLTNEADYVKRSSR